MVKYMALDVGERRIGVALADDQVTIAIPYDTLDVDGTEIDQIVRIARFEEIDTLVVGYPRNQSGEPTAQTAFTEAFVRRLPLDFTPRVVYQDESVTSLQAEHRLKEQKKPYTRGDIDKVAASIILQDYLEARRGRL